MEMQQAVHKPVRGDYVIIDLPHYGALHMRNFTAKVLAVEDRASDHDHGPANPLITYRRLDLHHKEDCCDAAYVVQILDGKEKASADLMDANFCDMEAFAGDMEDRYEGGLDDLSN